MSKALALLLLAFITLSLCANDLPVTGRADPALAPFDKLMLDFLREHDVPGGALCVGRNGRIVYARGFGYADKEAKEPVDPDALFRIASCSKMFTSAAILQLQERGKLKIDDRAFEHLSNLQPHLENGDKVDPRLWQITIRQLLHHTGGFDRDAKDSFDPMFRSIMIARATGHRPPAYPNQIIEYMMGRPLDFDPGTKEAYSNFGYCVLGRIIERASGQSYQTYVVRDVLQPLGIKRMRIARSLEQDRAPGEVHYYAQGDPMIKSDTGDGQKVPSQYGGWCIEAMDAHGGWIASAPELVRFAQSFDDPNHGPILKADSIAETFRRSKETGYEKDGKPKAAYYANGWMVRPVGKAGKMNTWHNGLLDGTASLVVRRSDGLTWAVLFNTDRDAKRKYLGDVIDPLVHQAADQVKRWPEGWEFKEPKPD